MNTTIEKFFTNEEKATLALRKIYESYGYSRFKMGKFEEYDLYAQNKDFLLSENVITFTDINGKLMALKPDVTLSIIKSLKLESDCIQKVYYNENIYRVSKDTHIYKEFMQTGLECVGDVDSYTMLEVLLLAVKSLEAISDHYVLTLSHVGIINVLLGELDFSPEKKQLVFRLIGERNVHGIEDIFNQAGTNQDTCKKLVGLISSCSSAKTVLENLRGISVNAEMDSYISELEFLYTSLTVAGFASIQIDFSTVTDMIYYNGIVFQGFISGIHTAVISGGRYDKLLHKMGKNCGGIGFAFYMNLLESRNLYSDNFDVDVLLLYDSETNMTELMNTSNDLICSGKTVQLQKSIPALLKYKQLAALKNGRLEILESND